jgi:hypothetical protein
MLDAKFTVIEGSDLPGSRIESMSETGDGQIGNALMAGIAGANGRFIIMGDADDSYDLSALDGFSRTLRFFLMFRPRWPFLIPGAILMAIGLFLFGLLIPGTFFVSRVGLDIHTLLFASLLIIVGFDAIACALLARVLAVSMGFLTLGSQIGLGTFFLSILNLQRRNEDITSTAVPGNILKFFGPASVRNGQDADYSGQHNCLT